MTRAWDLRFFDDFDDASIGISTAPGNGAITEPAGTELLLAITAGQVCQWWDGVSNAPVAYEAVATHENPVPSLLRFETKLSGFVSRTGVELLQGLCLWGPSRRDAYLSGWYDGNDDMYLQRGLDDVFTTQWQLGNYGDPNTTAHIYRLYVNKLPRRVYLPEVSTWLEPGNIGFVYSANNGTSWAFGYQESIAFFPTYFGVYIRNWTYSRGGTAEFDYLKFEQNYDPEYVVSDGESGDGRVPESTQPGAATSVEVGLPSQGGDSGRGQDLDLAYAHAEVETSPVSIGGDELQGFRRGHLLDRGADGHTEIFQVSQVIDADFLIEKLDGDGKALLNDVEVEGILLADATAGSFGTPVGNNHTGIAKNGKFYYDGVECTPGDFGTVAGGPRRTAWPIWSGGAEPWTRPLAVSTNLTMPSDDVLRFQGSALSIGSDDVQVTSQYGWRLRGDFDIQLDYFDLSFSGGTDGGFMMNVFSDSYNMFYVRRRVGGANAYDRDVKINNSWGSYASAATTDTAGKLRIVRSGTVVSQWYWDGVSSWIQIGSSVDIGSTNSAWVILGIQGTGSLNVDIKVANFTINSGTADNTARYTWEASGAHRGTQATMPDKLLVVTTKSSLELLDATNRKLWMRFLQGANNVLGATASGVRVRKAAWNNGLLFVAYGDDTGAGGAAIWIDFTRDEIRWHRTDANAATGGLYGYPAWWGRGVILERNNARNCSGDYTEWQIPSYKVDDVALYRSGIYEYRAVATLAGMSMHRYKRWYGVPAHEYSLSNEVSPMRWCELDQTTGELFYMSATDMYSRDKSGAGQGWEDWMTGGIWTAQYSKALPGFRTFDFQLWPARLGSVLFLPADEGVYRVAWPSGSWTLFYGPPLSAATHAILPECDYISAIEVANDGTNDLLLVSIVRKHIGQVVAIKLSDNSIYARAKMVDLKVPTVMEA